MTAQPFVSWHCPRCDCGSGSVLLAPGSAGDDVRDDAIGHGRITGCPVVFTRGTVETLFPPTPEQRLTGAIFGVDPGQVRDGPRLHAVDPHEGDQP